MTWYISYHDNNHRRRGTARDSGGDPSGSRDRARHTVGRPLARRRHRDRATSAPGVARAAGASPGSQAESEGPSAERRCGRARSSRPVQAPRVVHAREAICRRHELHGRGRLLVARTSRAGCRRDWPAARSGRAIVHSSARLGGGVRGPDSTSPATQTVRRRRVGARRRQLRERSHRDRAERRSHHRSPRASCPRRNRRRTNLRLRDWRMCPRRSGRRAVDLQSTALRPGSRRRRGHRARSVAA